MDLVITWLDRAHYHSLTARALTERGREWVHLMENTLNAARVTEVGVGQKWEEPVNGKSQLNLLSHFPFCPFHTHYLTTGSLSAHWWSSETPPKSLPGFTSQTQSPPSPSSFVLRASFDTIACSLEFLLSYQSRDTSSLISSSFSSFSCCSWTLSSRKPGTLESVSSFSSLYTFSQTTTTHYFQASNLPFIQISLQ